MREWGESVGKKKKSGREGWGNKGPIALSVAGLQLRNYVIGGNSDAERNKEGKFGADRVNPTQAPCVSCSVVVSRALRIQTSVLEQPENVCARL